MTETFVFRDQGGRRILGDHITTVHAIRIVDQAGRQSTTVILVQKHLGSSLGNIPQLSHSNSQHVHREGDRFAVKVALFKVSPVLPSVGAHTLGRLKRIERRWQVFKLGGSEHDWIVVYRV